MENKILFLVFAVMLLYLLYRLFSMFNRKSSSYRKLTEEILTSDKYRVKGRHE